MADPMHAPRPTAVFLDLDDTILADSEGLETSWTDAVQHFAARLPTGITAETLIHAICHVRGWYWDGAERSRQGRLSLGSARREIVNHAFHDLGCETAAPLATEIADAYSAARHRAMHPFPGAIETLARFRADGIRLALLTNGGAAMQRDKIERFGLAPFFDCIVVEGEFGIGKPDERVFRHALDRLGAAPAAAWMVGDNLTADIAPAVRLGLHAVWMDVAGTGLSATAPIKPHRIIRRLVELGPPWETRA